MSKAGITTAAQTPAYWVLTDHMRSLFSGEQTDGALAAFETTCPPGGGPPLHRHTREDEYFHILDGELTFTVDGQAILARTGDNVVAPRGSVHTFKNNTARPVRFIVIATSAGFGDFVRAVGVPAHDTTSMPPITPEAIARVMAGAREAGLEIFG